MDIDTIPLEVRAVLGTVTLPIENVQDLEVGDILVLEQSISEGIALTIGSHPLFTATAGLFITHKAVKIDGSFNLPRT